MKRLTLNVWGVLAAQLLMPVAADAQEVTAAALKAAFIYNFVKFTEWPETVPVSAPFVICVIGDAAVGDALARAIKGRDFAGRPLVALAADTAPKDGCQLLYVSGATLSEAAQAVAGLQDLPVLTISDIPGFGDTGGMAQFFFERDRLRFTIRVDAVKRSGLKMSSRLLNLAKP
jgi:hypothetical protein